MKKNKVKYINPDPLATTHFVCMGGCGLVSNEPMKCTSQGCPRYRNPLSRCGCEDGKHTKIPILNSAGFLDIPQSKSIPKKDA